MAPEMSEIKNITNKSLIDLKNSKIVQMTLKNRQALIGLVILILILLSWGLFTLLKDIKPSSEPVVKRTPENIVQITSDQSKDIKVGVVTIYDFHDVRDAIGVIDFDKYHTADVFSPYQGRINNFYVQAGNDVKKGQVLYTVLAPDVAQASSALLSAAGVLRQANETLKRAKDLYEFKSISQKELEQNISDQQTAEANYLGAKKSMALFGFSEEEIQEIVLSRKIDIELKVKSPINGRIITRSASPGQLVQPGVAPAPVTVSDINELWMVAQIPESETPYYRIGQNLTVSVQAYQDRLFPAKIVAIGDSIDPITRRLMLVAKVKDSAHELKPQMLASFQISIYDPQPSPAIPAEASVREGNGTRVVWVTEDGLIFKRRVIKIGLTQAGFVQVLDGLKPGETIAQNKALFLSNQYSLTH
jgi:cobalt-zinc-cadmium efflux system membrane fusion protein